LKCVVGGYITNDFGEGVDAGMEVEGDDVATDALDDLMLHLGDGFEGLA
jgi:hypothetical protein